MAGERPIPACPLVADFPTPGSRIQKAYHDLWDAQNGSEERKKKLGNPANLPRPWDPTTCLERGLRWELWLWLDQVVEWVNSEYVWEASGGGCIPDCWPRHPHLVHELAVLADQRRKAGHAPTSDLLENWHRYVLPGFMDRMRQRLKQSCDDDHQPWPARSRHARLTSEQASALRLRASSRIWSPSPMTNSFSPPADNSPSSTAVTSSIPTPARFVRGLRRTWVGGAGLGARLVSDTSARTRSELCRWRLAA